jgi:outer membrane protein assembly factor BamB
MSRFATLLLLVVSAPAFADDWPQWLGPQRDGVWRETGIIEKLPDGGPKTLWRTPIGEGYAGPAVAGGKVYITDRFLAKDAANPKSPFDAKSRVSGNERIVCLDAKTGEILWKHEYDCPYQISYASGPRTTPVVDAGKVYTLGAMGDLYCLDANKGDVIWSKNLLKEYDMPIPYWGFAGSPLIDGDRLICLVGGKGSVAVAFDKNTGKELWKNLNANEPGYCPPSLFTIGGKKTLIMWDPVAVAALEPESGKVIWSHPYPPGKKTPAKAGMTIPNPRLDGDNLFVSCFYEGSLMLKLDGEKQPTATWHSVGRSEKPDDTVGLHCVMSTPFIKDGHIYGICSYGELRCVDAKSGERVWTSDKVMNGKSLRWGNAFIIPQGDRYWFFNEFGELILATMSPKGYEEISRAKIIEPTNTMAGRRTVWTYPAFADRSIFVRNDREIIRVSLAK